MLSMLSKPQERTGSLLSTPGRPIRFLLAYYF
jgi:hypothetical protein